jgi:hypothetical protein
MVRFVTKGGLKVRDMARVLCNPAILRIFGTNLDFLSSCIER